MKNLNETQVIDLLNQLAFRAACVSDPGDMSGDPHVMHYKTELFEAVIGRKPNREEKLQMDDRPFGGSGTSMRVKRRQV